MTFEALSQHLDAFLALKAARARRNPYFEGISAGVCGMRKGYSAAFSRVGNSTDAHGRFVRTLRWIG
jgi:hypothetical protein